LWRDLTSSAEAFPAELLFKSGDTLASFVQGREN
jgi:hypothetical protein